MAPATAAASFGRASLTGAKHARARYMAGLQFLDLVDRLDLAKTLHYLPTATHPPIVIYTGAVARKLVPCVGGEQTLHLLRDSLLATSAQQQQQT